ncbi:MAG: ATP-binding protein [Pseudomonadota bacterium]
MAFPIQILPSLPRRGGNILFAVTLLLLHAAFVWGYEEAWGRVMVLAHFAAFLLWQPFFSNLRDLSWPRILGVFVVGGMLTWLNSLWAAALWVVLLAGLLAGVAVGLRDTRERIGMWIGVLYLLLLLFLWLLPQGFQLPMRGGAQVRVWRDSLLLLPLAMAFFPSPQIRRHIGVVDLLYTLLFELFIGVLALGSYAAMRLTDTDYGQGVLISLATVASSLLLVTWLWQPRGDDSGLRNLFSRYVLSLGLPLEEWLRDLSDAAERVNDPERFLRAAMLGFTHLPWSTGVVWKSPRSHDELGEHSPHAVAFHHQGVEVTFYTDGPVNPAFSLHLRLLTEIIGYFYAAKRREQEMQASAYTQAVYETGSRLTHDVKNLLQSLKALCSAAEYSQPEQATSLQNLMQRQLPQIAKRLEITLDKLKAPAQAVDRNQILAREWWRNLKNRYAQERLSFDIDDADSALWLPQEMFDSVADNLVQNAVRKRVGDPNIRIRVVFHTQPLPTLKVCDSGQAAGEAVVRKLFEAPVSTHDGLGIGLYQAAKQARDLGYRLELSNNRDGYVCFTLWQETL